jgi:hypothetical protein
LIYNKNTIVLILLLAKLEHRRKGNICTGKGEFGMDALLMVLIFSGLCLVSSFGMGLFILAAGIQSTRISKLEGIDEVHLTVQSQSKPAASDTFRPQMSESL